MSDDVSFFNAHCIALAKSMSLMDARSFLRGALELVGDEEQAAPLRRSFVALDRCAEQLEIFAASEFRKVSPKRGGR